ncbi:MAG TPA: Calx-beta domain-containing protein, partial [Gemmataceae bacterium]|nr:Calx-beta domain-containing protein [Gemmataceae bacterium]
MTRRLRSLFRAIYNNNHKTYNHRPNLEVLEDRLAPAGNIIATVAGPYPQHLFREYTASGALVRSVNVPPTPGSSFDYARDVEEDASGKVSIYNGTFTPYLATYNPGTSTWSQITYAGWSTVSNVSYGGLGLYQNFIYATDMNTAGNAQKGIVRFDTVSGNITRFGTNTDFTDLNIGLDSKVYGLAGSTILVFDPVSMAQIRTITLPSADYRGIAVSANGDIYTAAWNSVISRFNTNGTLLQSLTLNTSNGAPFMFSNPDDIDVAADGTVAVGTFSGHIAQLSSTLTNATYIDTGTNNTVFVTFAPAQQTSLSVNDVSVVEGTNVQTTATFTVTLSAPNNSQPVYVQYATGNGTATAPNDYQGTSGSLTFAPGQTSRTVTINIAADPITESTETFTLNLSNPVNATISRAQGTGTIIEDDTPAITINDVAVTEGNGGSTYANFTLSLSNPSPFTVSVGITTSNGTAQSGSDYAALSGATLYFAPGQLSQTVSIQIYGDIQFEADETFKLNLSNPTNATLARTFGTGT